MTLKELVDAINDKEHYKKEVIFATSDGKDLQFLSMYASDDGKVVYIDIGEEGE